MQIPEEFEFMNQKWQIQQQHTKQLSDDMGQCDPNTTTITIDPTLNTSMMQQTLWHELVHCFEITLQLDLPDRTVDLLALSLIHFFKTNPDFLTLLVEDTEHDYQ
jgi:hypothetical protein